NPKNIIGFAKEALEVLKSYDWPGNVRELENAVQHGCIRTKTQIIGPENLPSYLMAPVPKPAEPEKRGTYRQLMDEAERKLLRAALREATNNRAEAARLLDMDRSSFYRRLDDLAM